MLKSCLARSWQASKHQKPGQTVTTGNFELLLVGLGLVPPGKLS